MGWNGGVGPRGQRTLQSMLCAAALAGLCACGGEEPRNLVDGAADGLTLDARVALLLRGPGADGDGQVLLVLTDLESACRWTQAQRPWNGYGALTLALGIADPTGHIVWPDQAGVFEIQPESVAPGSKLAAAAIERYSDCQDPPHAIATGGQVALRHVSLDAQGRPAAMAGTFDVRFAKGRLQGRFEAALCEPFESILLVCE